MRAWFFVGSFALAAAAAAACAATGDDPEAQPEVDSGTGLPPVAEGGAEVQEAGTPDQPPPKPETCSQAGWCITALPDADLLMRDIQVLPGRAFAIAESPTLGVKVLEWVDAESKWTYVDDGTQNEDGRGRWVGRLWAPNENEIYFGVAPNYIFHGTRTAPGAAFSWDKQRIGTNNPADPDDGNLNYWKRTSTRAPSLGVWGTSSGDVYAWFKDTIYRRASVDGGAPEWVPDYTASDKDVATEQFYFFAAAGTSPDEVWFAGARSRVNSACVILLRRTAGAYERITDGTAGSLNQACKTRAGSLLMGGAEGWLTDLEVVSTNQLVGLKGARDVVKISVDRTADPDAGAYSFAYVPIPSMLAGSPVNSLSAVAGDVWIGGVGVVVKGESDVWDGGKFELSTMVMNGAPLNRPIYQVRGTSNSNLWAIGVRNALHKSIH